MKKTNNFIDLNELKNDLDKKLRWSKKHPVLDFVIRFPYKITNFIKYLPLRIKSFFQRGKRGWADRDIWSLDYYLSGVIKGMVNHLKNTTRSTPGRIKYNEWREILKKIEKGFEIAQKISNNDIYYTEKNIERNKMRKLLGKKCVITEKQIEEYKEMWKLLEKYFFDLWD